jgi:hypothetical protein
MLKIFRNTKRILLIREGKEILGSDGLMHIDGRLSLDSVKEKVRERNKRYEKNFPHKICDSFYFVGERLENKIGDVINL